MTASLGVRVDPPGVAVDNPLSGIRGAGERGGSMIEKRTVLILGAGASIPFGYPSGKRLLETIVEQSGYASSDLQGCLRDMGYTSPQIVEFGQTLRYSGRASVDAFLEYRPDFMPIGKAAMADVLIRCETERRLWEDPKEDPEEGNWYGHLFNLMTGNFEDFGENKLTVITYNYDRSLEHFLFVSLSKSYRKKDDQVAAQMAQVPIMHVHGILGALPWQEGRVKRAYGPDASPEEKMESAKMIRIVHEEADEKHAFADAWKALQDAQRIYFLGFGYNEANLQRLQLNLLGQEFRVDGSCYKLTDKERMSVEGLIMRQLRHELRARMRIRLDPEPDHKVLAFLRHRAALD